MKKKTVATFLIAICSLVGTSRAQDLMIDFNSLTQDGGPHNHDGFQSYEAGHEIPEDFTADPFTAFGTTVTIQPSWPDSFDNRTQQMIDRGNQSVDPPGGFDATWLDVADTANGTYGLNLVTDFLGIDTRVANGGNGDWDGTTGFPTTMLLTISGLPADDYVWQSFHHDTEHVHGEFEVQLSTDGGSNYTQQPNGIMTDGSTGGNPDSTDTATAMYGAGVLATTTAEMEAAGSIYEMGFTTDGSDVVIQFQPYSGVAVHEQIWGINGFILSQGTITEPTLACDAFDDGNCNVADLDAMYDAAGSTDSQFNFASATPVGDDDLPGWLDAASSSDNSLNPMGLQLVSGDLDLNFSVTSGDLGVLLNNFNATAASPGEGVGWGGGDLNMDGSVDSVDLGRLLNNFGKSSVPVSAAVPEPSAVSLLLIGGLCLIRRRRNR